MKKIWKFHLDLDSVFGEQFRVGLEAPLGARPLCVGLQGRLACLWMEVDPSQPVADFVLLSVGTGHGLVPEDADYLGTVFDDPYVYHLYVPRGQGS